MKIDSSMIAAVRNDCPGVTFHKLADKNHLTKNFTKDLYKMRDAHSQLNRKGAITHIKKCFGYTLSQNKGDSENLANTLIDLTNHLFDQHENCGDWCESDKKHSVKFSDVELYKKLVQFFKK